MDDLKQIDFPVISKVPKPVLSLADMLATTAADSGIQNNQMMHLKFLMTGLLNGIAHITAIRMCPPLTNKNWDIYKPILALGKFLSVLSTSHQQELGCLEVFSCMGCSCT